ncbi:MAG: ATP-dependent helicase HrpB [Xanthobacteraceae bacterium]|nr:ATP-dependent helicase HrpB [Xanthobacteraceae bacterium]
MDPALPIDDALPALTLAVRGANAAVLVAPPGAGKTTRVPLALAQEPWAAHKKIIVLEPRRLAARAAAARMAATLGEDVGETVGYRVRFGSKVSKKTRIELVTEGVFTRMVLDDPALDGVAALLFDEFHERSLDADLGLALARDVQRGLRDDLKILVMSATIDGARVAKLLGNAPVIESEGRIFPVDTHYLGRDATAPIERQVADAAARALRAEPGSVLAFLPGAAEIRRAETLLKERIDDPSVDVVALFGALEADVQDRAIAPSRKGRRKVVLATSIAETSLTIEGVRIVIDCGLSRVPRYEPDVGLTRLETVRVSRASADQRRGRAGRTEPGVCYRLWDEPQTASLAASGTPEILAADLSSLVLDLAHWGVSDPTKLDFLDPPPQAAWSEARALLTELGAIDRDGRITDEGRALRQLPLPPRIARMVVDAAAHGEADVAADIAAVLTERGLGGNDVDLGHRLDNLRRDRSRRAQDARAMAKRWAQIAAKESQTLPRDGSAPSPHSPSKTGVNALSSGEGWGGGSEFWARRDRSRTTPTPDPSPQGGGGRREPSWGDKNLAGDLSPGLLLALAYPDRIARSRGAGGSFLLANGRGAHVDQASALSRENFLAVGEIAGTAAQGRVLLAAAITLAEIETHFADRIEARDAVAFDASTGTVRARALRRLGAVTLGEQSRKVEPDDDTARMLAEGIARLGLDRLPWSKPLEQWRDRVMFLRRAEGDEWPDLSDAALAANAGAWLAPAFAGKTAIAALGADEFADAVYGLLPWNMRRRLDAEAPTHFAAPSGSSVPIDYGAEEGPKLAIRVQELFGLDKHPTIAGGRVPLVVELLSPAHRPVQVTRDLPGFWRGSYAAVKTEMKGRYPRHPWPDNPLQAPATRRAKPRGT